MHTRARTHRHTQTHTQTHRHTQTHTHTHTHYLGNQETREEIQEGAPWTGVGRVNRNKRWGVTLELAMARPLVVEAELI